MPRSVPYRFRGMGRSCLFVSPLHHFAEFRFIAFAKITISWNTEFPDISGLFRTITEIASPLFRGIFMKQNSVENPSPKESTDLFSSTPKLKWDYPFKDVTAGMFFYIFLLKLPYCAEIRPPFELQLKFTHRRNFSMAFTRITKTCARISISSVNP